MSVIKSQLRKDEKFSQGIRLHTAYQIAIGRDAKDLEALHSSSRKSICNWIHRYNAEVVEGLKGRPRCGRNHLIDATDKAELQKIFSTVLRSMVMTLRRGQALWCAITSKSVTALNIKKTQIYNILHSVGFSFQKRM